MELFSQPRHLLAQRESGRSSETQIRQGGSRFGATHVTGGSVFQGNFVGLTVSKCIPTLLTPLYPPSKLTMRRRVSGDST